MLAFAVVFLLFAQWVFSPSRRPHPGRALMVTAIEVDNVSKRFSLNYTRTLQQMMVARGEGEETRETFSRSTA